MLDLHSGAKPQSVKTNNAMYSALSNITQQDKRHTTEIQYTLISNAFQLEIPNLSALTILDIFAHLTQTLLQIIILHSRKCLRHKIFMLSLNNSFHELAKF